MIHLKDRPPGQTIELLLQGSIPSLSVYKEAAAASGVTYSVNAISASLTKLSFTPLSTGVYSFVSPAGEIVAVVEVVAKPIYSYLKNIEDEALGSWVWDRVAGTLRLLRQDGSELAHFAVVDTQTESSRERLQ